MQLSQGVKAWLDDCLVALCVDGASVLLSGVHSQVKQQAFMLEHEKKKLGQDGCLSTDAL